MEPAILSDRVATIRKGCSRRTSHTLPAAIEGLESRLLLSASFSWGGTPTITPDTPVNASGESSTWQSEVTLAVNPANPLNLAGFSHNFFDSGAVQRQINVYYSSDGGATWDITAIDEADDGLGTGANEITARFDPTITFDEEGRLFIGYCATVTIPNVSATTSLVVGRSEDGGQSFDLFTVVDSGQGLALDKCILTSGHDPSSGGSAIYVAYTDVATLDIVVAGSNDEGESFTSPVTVSAQGFSYAGAAVGPGGELYISWWDHTSGKLWFDRDQDGLWASTHSFGSDIPVRTLVNGSIAFEIVPAHPDRGIHTAPILAVDRSGGAYAGRLYLSFIEWQNPRQQGQPHDNDSNVIFGYSTNRGTNWTFLDGGAMDRPLVDPSTGTEFFPWVDVDQATGSVNLLYYTTDGDQASGNNDVKMRMGVSINGGTSWSTSNVTTITSNADEPHDADYGDYLGFDVHQGTAHSLFSFEPPGGPTADLDAVYVNTAFANTDNILTIEGDDSGFGTNDTIVVRKHPSNNDYLQVLVNNVEQFAGRYDTIGKLVINGLGANDTITVNSNVSIPATINGGGGNDSITGGAGSDFIYGNSEHDTLIGGLGSDWMEGNDGNDHFDPVDGVADQLFGGAGLDRAYGMDASDTEEDIELFGPPGGGGSGPSP